MDEYAASYSQIEKLIKAAQCIKENLVCRICLEFFKEPVTIICGHKFCRSCILRVAKNQHAFCPFCNVPIQRRSIPKEGNEILELCLKQFNALTDAIISDSGIDVLQSHKKAKHTKESALLNERSRNSNIEEASTTSDGSSLIKNQKPAKSRTDSESSGRLSLRRKQGEGSSRGKTASEKKNALSNYLVKKTDCVPNQVEQSDEKVKNWLKNITQDINDESAADSKHENISSNSVKLKKNVIIKTSSSNVLREKHESSLTSSSISKSKHASQKSEEPKYKETQLKLQEIEMIAKKKKSNQSLPEKALLKTPSSVPAASHSDTWGRVKRVGKEMQAKTFKSLNVSVEKSSSSIVLDDTVPCDSSKNCTLDSSTKNDDVPVVEIKQKMLLEVNDSFAQKENSKNIIKDCNYKNRSLDSSSSYKEENVSLPYIDHKRVNEIIELLQDNLNTPERPRNISNASNQECTSNLNKLSPLKISAEVHHESELSEDESTHFDSKTTDSNLQSSPSKSKLSLKIKLKNSINSKSINSQPNSPEKTNQKEYESSRNYSPERSKSRLSLRIPMVKTNECSLSQNKSPRKSPRKIVSPRKQSNVVFKKLGKIYKRRKIVPFLKLGKIKPKDRILIYSPNDLQGIVVKSNVPVNFTSVKIVPANRGVKMLSPEKDSQLKLLSIDSPCNEDINENKDKFVVDKLNELNVPMEIDESLPTTSNILKDQLDFREENVNSNENESSQINNKDVIEETRVNQLKISICKTAVDDPEINIADHNKFPENSLDKVKEHDEAKSKLIINIEKCKVANDVKITEEYNSSPVNTKVNKMNEIQEDVISISSHESESENTENHSIDNIANIKKNSVNKKDRKDRNKASETESNADSESSLTYVFNNRKKKFVKEKSVSTSTSSSVKMSPLKKKRTRSESSNEDVSSIIDKWCEPDEVKEPIIKKPKIISNIREDLQNKSKHSEDFVSDDNDNTLVDDAFKESEHSKLERDPPIDDIISKVKYFKENEVIANANKLIGIPSSLISADLFESNEQCVEPSAQISFQQSNKSASNDSSVSTWSPNKKSEKENLNTAKNSSDVTILDLLQFNRKNSNLSESSDGSNKENNTCNKIVKNTFVKAIDVIEDQINKNSINEKCKTIGNYSVNSPQDSYHVPDSLMDITQEQVALKKIEKALIGADLSNIHENNHGEIHEDNNFSTPRRKHKFSQVNNNTEYEIDTDNIDGTPVMKKRQIFNFPTSKSTNSSGTQMPDAISPIKNVNLIPAVTPVRNTKSYPLSHSTPMVNTPNPKSKSFSQNKKITLICSGLHQENTKMVQKFAKRFKADFQNSFNADVTHVIVQTDPITKAGKKTLKYIQGIAFKKYVVSFQWIVDCLKQDTLLDEDEEKYEVLDPDVLEPGPKRSRMRTQELFERFAFFCFEPFNTLSLDEFKNLLTYNGAVIASTITELSHYKNKYRVVILESENLSQKKVSMLKKSGGILVSFEWIVDSISQYQILSLFPYLCESTIDEALALGFPPEYLTEEEIADEGEEEEEEEEG